MAIQLSIGRKIPICLILDICSTGSIWNYTYTEGVYAAASCLSHKTAGDAWFSKDGRIQETDEY